MVPSFEGGGTLMRIHKRLSVTRLILFGSWLAFAGILLTPLPGFPPGSALVSKVLSDSKRISHESQSLLRPSVTSKAEDFEPREVVPESRVDRNRVPLGAHSQRSVGRVVSGHPEDLVGFAELPAKNTSMEMSRVSRPT